MARVDTPATKRINVHRNQYAQSSAGGHPPSVVARDRTKDTDVRRLGLSLTDREAGIYGDKVKSIIHKARRAVKGLRNLRKSTEIKSGSKLRIFNPGVKSVLAWESEAERTA